jgi:hypothetical protein
MIEEDEIIAFIKDSEDGRRWVDLTREFENKRCWSHGKFVNHWKKTEPLREQRPTEKGKRYFIKGSCEKEATKSVLVRDLREQDLSETELPSQTTFNFFFNSIKKQVDVVRHLSLNPRDKLKGKKGEFYGNFYAQFFANRYSKYIKLNIMHLKGQKPPNLDVPFGRIKKIQSMKVLDVLHYCFVSVAGEYEREMAHALPFQLLLTYDPPSITHEDLLKEVSVQTKDLYPKWLLKFNQKDSIRKENEFALELSKYIKEIHKRRLKALQKS